MAGAGEARRDRGATSVTAKPCPANPDGALGLVARVFSNNVRATAVRLCGRLCGSTARP